MHPLFAVLKYLKILGIRRRQVRPRVADTYIRRVTETVASATASSEAADAAPSLCCRKWPQRRMREWELYFPDRALTETAQTFGVNRMFHNGTRLLSKPDSNLLGDASLHSRHRQLAGSDAAAQEELRSNAAAERNLEKDQYARTCSG